MNVARFFCSLVLIILFDYSQVLQMPAALKITIALLPIRLNTKSNLYSIIGPLTHSTTIKLFSAFKIIEQFGLGFQVSPQY